MPNQIQWRLKGNADNTWNQLYQINEKSLSINQISKVLGVNWRTAKKYADEDQLPEEKISNDVYRKVGWNRWRLALGRSKTKKEA